MKIYFNKIQKTSDNTITKFYYNKNDKNYNNLQFLTDKINSLLSSEKTSDNVKKQLSRLKNFNFNQYNCFYIYSNSLMFGINSENKTIDFYNNSYDSDSIINLDNYNKNYNCKLTSDKTSDNDIINASDFN